MRLYMQRICCSDCLTSWIGHTKLQPALGPLGPDDLKLLVSNSQVQVQVLFWSENPDFSGETKGGTHKIAQRRKNWWKFVTLDSLEVDGSKMGM